MAMKKPVPGSIDLQNAIENAYSAQYDAKTDTERLDKIGTAVQQLAYGLKQALQAIYDEVV